MKLTDDPLWYKDAIIYEAHVKSFFDSTNDGIGDFPRPDRASSVTCRTSASRACGCSRSSRRRSRTTGTTSRTTAMSTRATALSKTSGAGGGGARAGHPGAHRARRQPHVRPAPVVPGRAPGAAWLPRAGVLRLERHGSAVSRNADHLHRHREIELDLRRRRRAVPTGTASSRISPI